MNDLQKRIAALEARQEEQLAELRQTANNVVASLSPVNLLKNAVSNVASSPDLRASLLDTAIGIGAGIVSKKLVIGRSSNMFKKVGGLAIEFLVGNFVRKRIPGLRKKTATNGQVY